MPDKEKPPPDDSPDDTAAADAEVVAEVEEEAAELSAADQLATHVNTVKNFLRATAALAVSESVQFHINMASVAMLAAITEFYINAKDIAQNARAKRHSEEQNQGGVRAGGKHSGDGSGDGE